MARRKIGEGSWGKKIIKGIEYEYYRKSYNGKMKYFYGKSQKEIKAKIKTYEKTINLNSEKTIRKMSFYDYATKWLTEEKKDNLALKTYDNYENYINNQLKNSPQDVSLARKLIGAEPTRGLPISYNDNITLNNVVVNPNIKNISKIYENWE